MSHEKIFVAKRPEFDEQALVWTLQQLEGAAVQADTVKIRLMLSEFVDGCAFKQGSVAA